MKKLLISVFIVIITINLFSFYQAQARMAISITCTGDRSVVCAKGTTGSGGTWEVYGDKAVVQE